MNEYEAEARRAAAVMLRGGVVLYPTDTVWGLGCDATDAAAVRRIYDIKRRADAKSFILLVPDVEWIERYVEGAVSDECRRLATDSARPTTVIYDHAMGLAPGVTADNGSVAIRVTAEAFSAELCRACGKAIVSTSANISGRPAPGIYADIDPAIVDAVDYVVAVRRDETTAPAPSRIVKLTGNSVEILRP